MLKVFYLNDPYSSTQTCVLNSIFRVVSTPSSEMIDAVSLIYAITSSLEAYPTLLRQIWLYANSGKLFCGPVLFHYLLKLRLP